MVSEEWRVVMTYELFRKALQATPEERENQKKQLDLFSAKENQANLEKLAVYNLRMAKLTPEDRERYSLGKFQLTSGTELALKCIERITAEHKYGMMLWGPPGIGKTHLMKGFLIDKVLKENKKCIFYSMNDLMNAFRENLDHLTAFKEKLISYDVVAIDDFGAEKTTEFVEAELLSLMDRMASGNSILIASSNSKPRELMDKYGIRTFDRLNGCVKFIECKGQSRRKL